MNYLILIVVAIISFAIGRKTAKTTLTSSRIFAPKQPEEILEMQEEAREALTERTENRKGKILNLMNSEAVHDEELKACVDTNPNQPKVDGQEKGITTENVEKLLDVSGATARKYLNELEEENKIKQIGKTGRDVYYVLGGSS